jgi:hypothetical protein
LHAPQDRHTGAGQRGRISARWRAAAVAAAAALALAAGAVPASAAGGYTVTGTIPVGANPEGVAADPATHTAYVTSGGGEGGAGTVSVISAARVPTALTASIGLSWPRAITLTATLTGIRSPAARPARLLQHRAHPPVHPRHQHSRRGHLRAVWPPGPPGRTGPRHDPGQLPRKRHLPAIISDRGPAAVVARILGAAPAGRRARGPGARHRRSSPSHQGAAPPDDASSASARRAYRHRTSPDNPRAIRRENSRQLNKRSHQYQASTHAAKFEGRSACLRDGPEGDGLPNHGADIDVALTVPLPYQGKRRRFRYLRAAFVGVGWRLI